MQHIDVIAHRNRQGTTGAAFADNGTQHRHAQAGKLIQIAADGLRLAALLGANTRISAGRVDKSEHGNLKFFCRFHQAQGFAVAFRLGHTKIAADFFFGVAPFLMANHHHALAVKTRQAAHNGGIIGKSTVAVQLFKIGAQGVDIIQGVRALGMARHLRHLHRREFAENRFG